MGGEALYDQHNKGSGERTPRNETADLARRYGAIGISAVAAALPYQAGNNNECRDWASWRTTKRDNAA
jgi:hypothetical protein